MRPLFEGSEFPLLKQKWGLTAPFLCDVRGMRLQCHDVPLQPYGFWPTAKISNGCASLHFAAVCRTLFEGSEYPLLKKYGAHKGLHIFSRRERDSNPRSCDRLRISRPAQSTTLASLRGSHNVEKKHPFVYPPNKNPLIPFFYFYIWPQIQ